MNPLPKKKRIQNVWKQQNELLNIRKHSLKTFHEDIIVSESEFEITGWTKMPEIHVRESQGPVDL